MEPGNIKNIEVPQVDQSLIELGLNPADYPADQPDTTDAPPQPGMEAQTLPDNLHFLTKVIASDNVCDIILEKEDGESDLDKIGSQVCDDFDIDKGTCDDWYKVNEKGMELAKANPKTKSFPWNGAANVIVPLIQQAAIAYNARVYPEVFQDGQVAKSRIFGDVTPEKQQRADRVAQHLNYDLLYQMKDWEGDTDRLLMAYSIVGTAYRKVYHDPIAKRNVALMLLPDAVIVNNGIQSLETARRVTHLLEKHESEINGLKKAKLWRDVDLGHGETTDDKQPEDDQPLHFLEQHRWLDLDDDGIDEPYVVTVHKSSRKVVRIVARFTEKDVRLIDDEVVDITAQSHFQDYHFVPSPDGTFLSYGWGALIGQLNRAANSTLNSLLNAGTISNVQGGFLAKNFRMIGGEKTFQPGEWRKTDVAAEVLQQAVYPLPAKEPSQVLAGLFEKLLELAQGIVQVANINLESLPANAAAASTLAVIEQQSKTFNALFKRFYRSLTGELRMLASLNARNLGEMERFAALEASGMISRADYEDAEISIIPVADPQVTTQAQRIALAQAVYQTAKEIPGSNIVEAGRDVLKAMGCTDIDSIIKPAGKDTIPPEVQQQMQQMSQSLQQLQQFANQTAAELQAAQQLLLNKDMDMRIKAYTAFHDASLTQAKAIQALADARGKGVDQEIAQFEAALAASVNLRDSLEAMLINVGTTQQPGDSGMAVPPGNPGATLPAGL